MRGGRVWAYIGMALGGLVSICANVAHSFVPPAEVAEALEAAARATGKTPEWSPAAGAVVFSALWPVFLFVALEILARNIWRPGWGWGLLRFGGLVPVAVVAAVVSYLHLSGLLAFYGEDDLTVAIGPLAVDGIMVVATGALIGAVRPEAQKAPAAVTEEPEPEQPEPLVADTPDERSSRPTPATAKVARARRRTPAATQQQIATKTGLAIATVRRQWPLTEPVMDSAPVNGRVPELTT